MKENHHGHQSKDKSKPNPDNSAVIQALIDVLAFADDNQKKVIESALSLVKSNRELRIQADRLFQSHEYANIKYTKVAIYQEDPGFFELTPEAIKILMLFNGIASQEGYVRLSVSTIHDITHIRRNKIITGIKELIEYQYIATAFKPPKGSKYPPIYLIDRRVLRSGKEPSPGEIKKYESLAADIPSKNHIRLLESSNVYYATEMIKTKITDENGNEHPIKVGSLAKREKAVGE